MADRISDDEFMGALLRLNTWKNLPSYIGEGFSDKFNQHRTAHKAMSDDLLKRYTSSQAGTPFDVAKNYAGGYDYGYRSPEDVQRAVDMARLYQMKDLVTSPLMGIGELLGPNTNYKRALDYFNLPKQYVDAKNDFYENVRGVREGAAARQLGVDYDPGLIEALAQQFAEKYQRKARGGLVQMKECNCGR